MISDSEAAEYMKNAIKLYDLEVRNDHCAAIVQSTKRLDSYTPFRNPIPLDCIYLVGIGLLVRTGSTVIVLSDLLGCEICCVLGSVVFRDLLCSGICCVLRSVVF